MRRLLPTLFLLLVAGWATATAYRSLSPADIFLRADSVVTGTVLDVETVLDGELVWTEVRFEITRVLSSGPASNPQDGSGVDGGGDLGDDLGGDLGGDLEDLPGELRLRFLGGVAASGEALLVAGMPDLSNGEQLLLALRADAGLASPLVGFEQGLWRLAGDGARDTFGRYLGLLPAALAPDDEEVLGRSDTPAPLDAVLQAIERLLAGDAGLAGDAAEEPADLAGDAEEAPELAELEEGAITATYRVDDLGGPLLLSDAVAAAAASWVALAPPAIAVSEAADAGTLFAYGDRAWFDADTFALTLLRGGRAESLLSPAAGEMLDAALLHELGLLLGLPETTSGLMSRALSSPAAGPGPEELVALARLAAAVPGDLTGDGRVDFLDLLEFASRFGNSGPNEPADLNRDGIVGDGDLAALQALYEFAPPSPSD